jgi:hypothetical protein
VVRPDDIRLCGAALLREVAVGEEDAAAAIEVRDRVGDVVGVEAQLRFLLAQLFLRQLDLVDIRRDDVVAVEAPLHHDGGEAHLVPARLAPRQLHQPFMHAGLAALEPLHVRLDEFGRCLGSEHLAHLAPHDALHRQPTAFLEHLVGEDVAELAIDDRDGPGDVLGEVAKLALLVLERLEQLVVLLDVDQHDEHAEHVALRVAVGNHRAADVARFAPGPERLALVGDGFARERALEQRQRGARHLRRHHLLDGASRASFRACVPTIRSSACWRSGSRACDRRT